jgi:phosphonopyruvate decarboxylase
MIDCAEFFPLLAAQGIEHFSGVPDSLLKDFCAYVTDHAPAGRHIITANEGAAIALATGHHLATGGIGLVYLQNSGLGNTINPLTSLTDPAVYSIPVLLLIGWRGEPGVHDEPQHVKQGAITLAQLDTLGIPHAILPDSPDAARVTLDAAVKTMRETSAPFALVVRKGTFAPYKLRNKVPDAHELTREQAIVAILGQLDGRAVVVSTTGMTSREVYEYRVNSGGGAGQDFLTVGCMGHASQIALGIALARPERDVVVLDGDGALLMHMGSLAIIGSQHPANFRHVVLNNAAHDSVGGQPTVAGTMDLPAIARACGYRDAFTISKAEDIQAGIRRMREGDGPTFVEVLVNKGARADLGRPKRSPIENKRAFMEALGAPAFPS